MSRTVMNIGDLCRNSEILQMVGSLDQVVTGLYWDSRSVEMGGVFFALSGEAVDGYQYIQSAIEAGAVAIVTEKKIALPDGVTCLVVANSRLIMAQMARVWFDDPTNGIPVVAITGTNGKTTTSYLVESILKHAGFRPAVLGTVSYRFEDEHIEASHTTPESVTLFEIIRKFRDSGCDAVVMEVSSHALVQHRTGDILFDSAVFTNLSPEHLDYHVDMEDYFASKKLLFSQLVSAERGVSNIDDTYGRRLSDEISETTRCGVDKDADVRIDIDHLDLKGVTGSLIYGEEVESFSSSLLGQFNVENIVSAAAACAVLDIELPVIADGISAAQQVPGRLERIENSLNASILVDYAHTPDALEKALRTVAALQPERLLSIVGCGGDRDRTKRPVMGESSCRIADITIITSDNPRTEDPEKIIADVVEGAQQVYAAASSTDLLHKSAGKGYLVESDRKEAIELAVRSLRAGDLLLIAGKGHEDYQIIGTTRYPFDDRKIARECLKEMGAA